MRKSLLFVIIFLLVSLVSYSQRRKSDIQTPVEVSYALPKLMYKVEITMELSNFLPGKYSANAEKNLGVSPPSTIPFDRWKIIDIKLIPIYVPDNSMIYSMKASGEYTGILLSLTKDGILQNINNNLNVGKSEINNTGIEDVLIPQGSSKKEISLEDLNLFDRMKEVLDSNYTEQEIDGVIKKIWDPIIHYQKMTDEEVEQKLVKEIMRIRSERRMLLDSDNGIKDGKILEILLNNLNKTEKEYMRLFLGETKKSIVKKQILVDIPKDKKNIQLFNFSSEEGLNSIGGYSSVACILKADRIIVPSKLNDISDNTASGVFYRVPAKVNMSLYLGENNLSSFIATIPQWGVVKTFPLDVIKDEKLSISFNTQYGSLVSVIANK